MVTSLTSVLRTVCTLLYYVVLRLFLLRDSSSCASALLAHDPYYYITVPRLYILIPLHSPLFFHFFILFLILFYRGSFKPRHIISNIL